MESKFETMKFLAKDECTLTEIMRKHEEDHHFEGFILRKTSKTHNSDAKCVSKRINSKMINLN